MKNILLFIILFELFPAIANAEHIKSHSKAVIDWQPNFSDPNPKSNYADPVWVQRYKKYIYHSNKIRDNIGSTIDVEYIDQYQKTFLDCEYTCYTPYEGLSILSQALYNLEKNKETDDKIIATIGVAITLEMLAYQDIYKHATTSAKYALENNIKIHKIWQLKSEKSILIIKQLKVNEPEKYNDLINNSIIQAKNIIMQGKDDYDHNWPNWFSLEKTDKTTTQEENISEKTITDYIFPNNNNTKNTTQKKQHISNVFAIQMAEATIQRNYGVILKK